MCISQYGICFAKGTQELPYAVSKKVLARTTWVMRFHAGQFRGFWGSSGPSQSMTLSFASCSIAVWSGSLDCWSWWPSSDMAGFSWADSKSAAMICCRGWCDSRILVHVGSLMPGFACYIFEGRVGGQTTPGWRRPRRGVIATVLWARANCAGDYICKTVRKCGVKLEICLIEGEPGKRADAEGRGAGIVGGARTVDAEGNAEGWTVGLSLLSPLPLGLRR